MDIVYHGGARPSRQVVWIRIAKKEQQQNQRNTTLLENSCMPSLWNPMVRSAYNMLAWKPNRNYHISGDTKQGPNKQGLAKAVCAVFVVAKHV